MDDEDLQDVSLQSPDDETAAAPGIDVRSHGGDLENIKSSALADRIAASKETNGRQDIIESPAAKIMRNFSGALKQFSQLEMLIAQKNVVCDRDVVEAVLNILVGGEFDLETNFVIKDAENIVHLQKLMEQVSEKVQAEIWSMLSGILRKSRRNLLAFTEVHFIEYIITMMDSSTPMITELLTDMLTVLAGFSITVTELQLLFSKLKAVDNEWPRNAPKLLKVLQQMPARHGPDEFFSFPGEAKSAIALPPIAASKWPYQNGWTFSTWLRLDPFAGVSSEQEKPYVFCIQTKTGIGYSAFFTGSVLVLTSNKQAGRGFQACIQHNFEPRKWYHVCLVYVYNRWKTSMIKCYVNGQLVSSAEMAWLVPQGENFDRCYIGASPDLSESKAFCGQMSTIYVFNEALQPAAVESLFNLGAAYKSHFRFDNESNAHIIDRDRRVLYDGKLTNAIIMMYSPVACDSHICLESSPTGNPLPFVHTPHAMLVSGVKAVVTHSIHSTLHSLGGIQMLFPLFGQLDCEFQDTIEDDKTICSTLMELLCDLLECSDTLQQQMIQSRGFLVLSNLLEEASPQHLTTHTATCIIRLVMFFSPIPTSALLVKHISDHLLFNPSLWIHADINVQAMLLEYLASEYLVMVPFTSKLRRISTVIQLMHCLKHYYWVINPQQRSGIRPKGTGRRRPSGDEITQLRALILVLVERIVTGSGEILEDELQCFLNFISTVSEPENLYDVLQMLVLFMTSIPASMVPLFDAKNGIRAIFKLLTSESEAICIQAMKLLGHFLSRSTSRRKAECMDAYNLFSLLGDRIVTSQKSISINLYNVMFEVLTERMEKMIVTEPHPEFNGEEVMILNPALLKVISQVIKRSQPQPEVMEVKRLFLDDLVVLCESNEENRRTILQMSVWQDWLFSLAYIYPQSDKEQEVTNVVLDLFRMLLYHAIKLEYGGWRVWIDTLSILHTRVSFEDFNIHMSRSYHEHLGKRSSTSGILAAAVESPQDTGGKSDVSEKVRQDTGESAPSRPRDGATTPSEKSVKFPGYRIPEFQWSYLHQKLVSDILFSIENEISKWRGGDEQQLIDTVNSVQQGVFVANCVHLVANISDVLITAVGGLLPLLSAATTTTGEIDVLEPGYGLSIEKAVSLLQRVLNLADIMVIASNVHLRDLEGEKNMTAGTMLRQCLRVVCTIAVRNCLDCRYRRGNLSAPKALSARNGGARTHDPIKALVDGVRLAVEGGPNGTRNPPDPIADDEHLLQESDITRLRAVLYRDIEDTKQAQWVAMAITYFISVLMVSKYRDILEPPSEPGTPKSLSTNEEQEINSEMPSLTVNHRKGFEDALSPSPSKRSNRSVSPHRPSDSEDESESSHQVAEVIADVHVRPSDGESDEGTEAGSTRVLTDHAETRTASRTDSRSDSRSDSQSQCSASSEPEHGSEKPLEDEQAVKVVPLELHSDGMELTKEEEPKGLHESNASTSQENAVLEEAAYVSKEGSVVASDENGESKQPSEVLEHAEESATLPESAAQQTGDDDHIQGKERVTDGGSTSNTDGMMDKAHAVHSTTDGGMDEESAEQISAKDVDSSSLETATTSSGSPQTTPSKQPSEPISSITVSHDASSAAVPSSVKLSAGAMPKPLQIKTNIKVQANLSGRLEKALGTCAPLLREIFLDFAPYFSKTLLGTKGQDLVTGGLTAIKMGNSAVELVMLLCSQEWQISLQKHAGLAFIELVNEGRLLSHTTRDHIVKVANEAEHILNKIRAEDANKQEKFKVLCAEAALETLEEELTCDRLITSAKRRDSSIASRLMDKVLNIVNSAQGPWGSLTDSKRFWKIDAWEDDSRRRRRMVPNPRGSTHPEAALRAAIEHGEDEDAVKQARDDFHAHLSKLQRQKSEVDIPIEDDAVADLPDVDMELAGPVALTSKCHLISFGLPVAGMLSITKYELFFEWDEEDEQNKKLDPKLLGYVELHGRWHFQEMRAIFSRRYLLQKRALEIFLINRTSVMFACPDQESVKKIINLLPRVGVGVKYGLRPSRSPSLASPRQLFRQSNMTLRWQRREISNFDYLMFLNTIAGRSYNDLNQYPVFPWVISNYTSESLDLTQPGNFRDLSKPIGSLNPDRQKFFADRYASWEHEQIPPFHYGTHYSTAAFVLNWMIRVEPFTTMFLNLQGGKFDHANRTFSSLARAWQNCQADTSDVKEVIPELYFFPEMFMNSNGFKFGTREDHVTVNDVELPAWAKSPEEFVRINREALESEIVSCQLHEWIDLIFGYKQQGPEAVRATNVFYYLTYEGSVDLAKIKDPIMREAIEAQIRSFGQTPSQLLTEPHPMRGSQMGLTPKMFTPVTGDICMTLKFWSNSPVIHLSASVFPQQPVPSVITILQNRTFAVNRWNNNPTPLPTPPHNEGISPEERPTAEQILASLPLALDPVLNLPPAQQLPRRTLGDSFDERIKLSHSNFTTSIDNRILFACGFWDNSFRVYDTDTGRINQSVYGHFDMVTCISRSEVNMFHDCFIVTGSRDCTCMLWQWVGKQQKVHSELLSSTNNPIPLATLTGHTTPVTSVVISAELGIVVSSSEGGACLLHTMNGDLLRSLTAPSQCTSPHSLLVNREGYITALFNKSEVAIFSVNGRLLISKPVDGMIRCMLMSRDGKHLVTAGDSGVVSVWRSYDMNLLYAYAACDAAIYDLALSYDQRYLLAATGIGSVVVYNIDFTKWHHDYQRAKQQPITAQL